MLKHIVMWQLKDHAEGADKASNAAKMKALLDARHLEIRDGDSPAATGSDL